VCVLGVINASFSLRMKYRVSYDYPMQLRLLSGWNTSGQLSSGNCLPS
jgi:hypothetical protein